MVEAPIPPGPPPPPLGHLKVSVTARVTSPPATVASRLFAPKDTTLHSPSLKDTKAATPNATFQSFYMFFYGTLMDPEVLQTILSLPDLPTTQPATISCFRVKMWGIYPALIPSDAGSVTGIVWEVTSQANFDRLAAYETDAYAWVECDAVLDGGEVLGGCRAFCRAEDPESRELEEGEFDWRRWQRYFKASVVRR